MGEGKHYNPGAALQAHRIAFTTRRFRHKLTQISGGHKGTAGTLVDDSYCVIEIPMMSYSEGQDKRKRRK